jgi:CRISPR-associated endoribonuclease Cas6
VPTLEFHRFRFHFQALEPLRLPPGSSANLVRGACGLFLRQLAPPDIYSRIFEPGRDLGPAPSGLADWPRPFVLRVTPLDGIDAAAGDAFSFDLHLFDLREPLLPYFQQAFAAWAESGIGPGRRRARLDRVEPLSLDEQPNCGAVCMLPLDIEPASADRVTIAFVTATELKTGGHVMDRPEFGVLFARLRDRVCTLRALYGPGALALDFRGMGERAAAIRLIHCDLTWQQKSRTSRRTGQTHPLGGFTGQAVYHGALAEFLPWLRAGRWTGVGRHTVWGKGEIHIRAESVD